MMRMSVYITDIYFQELEMCQTIIYRNFTVLLQESIIYYPGFSETKGNGLVFIEDVYE